jgi:VanZ family protein
MTRLNRYAEPILKAGFALALVVVLAVALYPLAGESSGNGDKVQHFAAFYSLTLLGAAAYRSRKALIWLVVVLSAYGALIEILQPLPPFGRDRDVFDWVADNIGVAMAVLPILLAQWRGRPAPQ